MRIIGNIDELNKAADSFYLVGRDTLDNYYSYKIVFTDNFTTCLELPKEINKTDLENGFELFKRYYEANFIKESTPYNGMLEALTELKKNYTLAVVSNKNDPFAKELVEHYFPKTFTVIQGTYNDKPKKPDPYIVNKCLEQLGAKKEECLFIGDTPVDVQTAKNSSLRRIIVTYGFRSREELDKVVPDETFVNTIPELVQKIKETL